MLTKANQTSFKKGHVPWNKGKKVRSNTGRTHFKKGQDPWNKGISHKSIRGKKHYRWKGGYWINEAGYKILEAKNKDKKYRIKEHRKVMEEHLGRKLSKKEEIHHINGNKLDNRIENLKIMTKKEHAKLHAKGGGPY